MSMLEKLQIQGIRSFGPRETDRQVMTFFSPLTLILGSNGTGKTTIIECLRNATTGDLPPGQGKVFIHDPKLNREMEVNAQIKLKFIDVTGRANVLTRSFLLQQNKASVRFKTVDTALVQYNSDGSRTTATPKCFDVGATVMELLGVPRVILENVIFCHQSDSNWPLSESRTLKTTFDNIFAATQYIKTLEQIRKQKIEFANGAKSMKETLKYLRANKEKADKYEEEVTKSEQRLEDCAETIRDIEESLEPLRAAWRALEDKQDQERGLQQKLRAEKEQLQYTENEVRRITSNLHSGELRVKIDTAKKELSGHFKDAGKKYMTALTEMNVNISRDLDMYYRALNFAVLKYHEEKMKDINRVIKELWQGTYCVDDIDYIQIKTDTDEKGLESSRRTYNYRVVMTRGTVEQDMRGRCSAGQKVLASLIIRLALAETFCQKCGILALDEPTTNLDRSNIQGLALSLAKIVQDRMRQRNFQMIVITHDEEFLRLLSQRHGYAEYFYKVEKSDDGCSRLHKCRLSTIM
ncbi:uncharacterized protein LOC144138242 [Haemaphysalis longicornis]